MGRWLSSSATVSCPMHANPPGGATTFAFLASRLPAAANEAGRCIEFAILHQPTCMPALSLGVGGVGGGPYSHDNSLALKDATAPTAMPSLPKASYIDLRPGIRLAINVGKVDAVANGSHEIPRRSSRP